MTSHLKVERVGIFGFPHLVSDEDSGERHFQEGFERRPALLDLRAEDRALPGVDEEGCGRLCGNVRLQIARALRLLDHARQREGPILEGGGYALANRGTLVGKLGAEISQQTARRAWILRQSDHGLEIAADARHGREADVREDRPALGGSERILLDDRRPEILLAGEMVVERPLGNAGRFRDVLHGGRVEAPAVQGLEAGGQNLVAEIRLGHGGNMTGHLDIVNDFDARSRRRGSERSSYIELRNSRR